MADPLFRFPRASRRHPGVEAWLRTPRGALGELARTWFDVLRACGDDVREVMHDGQPTACVGDAAFAYVDAFGAHVNVGFFQGAELHDPAGLLEGSNMAPLVAAVTVGICAGFLPHNFNPARIFMGDAGAMFLGLLLATMTITVGGRTADPFNAQTYFYFAPLAIPLVILGVPLADTAFSFVRRVVKRQSFAQADHEHLHHRLMRMGHGPRRAVVILWLWTALLSAVVLLPTFTERGNSLVPVAVVALGLMLYIYFHPGVRTAREEARQEADQDADRDAGQDSAVVDMEERRQARGGS